MSQREAIIVAGPNGSGKSTLTRHIREEGRIAFPGHYINADDIAQALAGDDSPSQEARERSAFLRARELRQEYRTQGVSFAFETVFSHPSTLIDLQLLKQAGYTVTLVYVTTGDAEVNVARVARRVQAQGHDVPRDKIRSRYERSLAFLPRAVEIADRAFIYDSTDETQLVAIDREGKLYVQTSLPGYLETRLRAPLEERRAERQLFANALKSGEMLVAPDEQAGEYLGSLRQPLRHFLLQSCGQQVVWHDRSLLQPGPPPQATDPFQVRYSEGYGTITPVSP